MRAIKNIFGVVAVLALMLDTLACQRMSQQEIIESFIDDAPPVDLTDRKVVERVAFHSQPEWVILQSMFVVEFVQGLPIYNDVSCPTVIDRSDTEAGTVDIEYRGDGCMLEDNGDSLRFDGRFTLTGDQTSLEVHYDDVVLTFVEASEDCVDVPYSRRLSLIGTVSFPGDNGSVPSSLRGHFDILVKIDISRYTDACRLVDLVIAHDHEIHAVVAGPSGEQTGYSWHGRSAMENREYFEYEAPSGSFSVEVDELVFDTNVCVEPIAGVITLSAGENTVDIVPNGATDCDTGGCAPWTLNGVEQPEPVCGIHRWHRSLGECARDQRGGHVRAARPRAAAPVQTAVTRDADGQA